ncbi:MAG: hypothetical protein NT019_00845 [Candidatus Adlerbacteria bacterium]|nr:hypothetical protein [Candidatus Adlerbacteria bacterium]
MEPQTRKWYGIVGTVVIIAIAATIYIAHTRKVIAPTTTDTGGTASTTVPTGTDANGGVHVGGVVDTSGIKAPDLTRPYTPLSTLPQSVQDDNKKLVATAVAQLKFDPTHIGYWLQLAALRKGANDFTGAEEIWIFTTKRWPKDPIAYNNLADLYENYLHQYAQAGIYWNKLILLQPDNIGAYLNLATMYNINMHDAAGAKTTLQAGLTANPNNADLKKALAALQ